MFFQSVKTQEGGIAPAFQGSMQLQPVTKCRSTVQTREAPDAYAQD